MHHESSTSRARPATHRRLRFGALIAAAAIMVAACGTNESPGGAGASGGAASLAPALSPAGPIEGTLTVWAMGNEGVKLSVMADAFMAENPGTTVNVTPVDWGQAVAKLQTAIAGGQTPDVSQMGTDMMGQFAATQALEPVPADFDQSAFFESAWNTNIVDGTVYGVPWYVETRLLYYRTDIAAAAGITEAPATMDDLKAMATALQGDGAADWGISLGTKNWQEYLPFLWSNGGTVVDEAGAYQLDSPEAVAALTMYDSYFEEGLSPKSVPEGFDITPAFVSGTHPMFFSGPWHLSLIREAGGADFADKWAIAQMPADVSSTSFLGGANLVVYKESQNKDLAWAFVKYLSEPASQVAWYKQVTVLPAVQAAWDDPALADDPNLAAFGQQLESTQAQPASASWSELADSLNATLEKLTTGDLSPQEAADEMQAASQSIGLD
jgi:multiple sugar transport system substrate-binding protein